MEFRISLEIIFLVTYFDHTRCGEPGSVPLEISSYSVGDQPSVCCSKRPDRSRDGTAYAKAVSGSIGGCPFGRRRPPHGSVALQGNGLRAVIAALLDRSVVDGEAPIHASVAVRDDHTGAGRACTPAGVSLEGVRDIFSLSSGSKVEIEGLVLVAESSWPGPVNGRRWRSPRRHSPWRACRSRSSRSPGSATTRSPASWMPP